MATSEHLSWNMQAPPQTPIYHSGRSAEEVCFTKVQSVMQGYDKVQILIQGYAITNSSS